MAGMEWLQPESGPEAKGGGKVLSLTVDETNQCVRRRWVALRSYGAPAGRRGRRQSVTLCHHRVRPRVCGCGRA